MGKIKTCTIARDREVFRPGETVSGHATLTVEGEVKARSVNIFCCGMTLTKWKGAFQRSYDSDYSSSEIYINKVIRTQVLNLAPGTHQYKYSFSLPGDSIPSSFENTFGSVRYFLRVEVDKPFPSINDHFYSPFTVLAYLDANLPVYKRAANAGVEKQLSKAFGLGNAGNLYLKASTDRTGYCPGENILINLEARNESTKDCGAVKATLVQHAFFKASSDTQRVASNIRTALDSPLEKGKTRVWHQLVLPVDPVPPTINHATCHIIKVTYSLNICVEVPLGIDLQINIPITICTVPLGMSVASKPSVARPGVMECAGSKSVNYAACTNGYRFFPKSEGNFNYLKYAPRTAVAVSAMTNPNPNGASALAAAAPFPGSTNLPQAHAGNVPSAPFNEPPPSYEESMMGVAPGASVYPALPSYDAIQPQPGKGSVMVMLFSEADKDVLKMYFRKIASTVSQHGGNVLACQSKLAVLPMQDTGALIIHFQSTQDGMNWFHQWQASEPSLSSRLWVLIAENKVKLGVPASHRELPTMSIRFLKRKPDLNASPAYVDEYKRLLNNALSPAKKRFGGKTILSSNCVTVVSGDWSSLLASVNDVTFVVTQWPCLQNYEEYTALFLTDPGLVRYTELFRLTYQQLSSLVFEVEDPTSFGI